MTTIVTEALWPFDNNTIEVYGTGFDGSPVGNPAYTVSLFGFSAAISLLRSSNQYVSIASVVPFNSTSFTIEAWIRPFLLTNAYYGIFGQCEASVKNLCLYFTVKNRKVYCGFYNNDTMGSTPLAMSFWIHVACVYSVATGALQVWVNGVLDRIRLVSPYLGVSGAALIGAISYNSTVYSFNGYIDEVRYTQRAKSAAEILNDATLTLYYSFDGGSTMDNGPNGINASSYGNVSTVTGVVNEALQFEPVSYLYYTYANAPLYFLRLGNYDFTIALWAKATGSLAASSLVFIYNGWCVHFLTTTMCGQLNANIWNGTNITSYGPILTLDTWTHVGYTYSYPNGIRLYINGSLYSTTGIVSFVTSTTPLYMKIGGTDPSTFHCSPYYGGQFNGALDEFHLYNRELTASEIFDLANR
ncbi:unnamed protein product [Rotaria sp. Silwood2]|nr:unnamed protein product [Rotaria sp. Silwood2]CAF3311621.1 unnamed protein product [Rotaria sp. Silwood2]CAF4384703.1 unnamed protein product [Rotaria sp. Silwood2]CAF4460584.1 unnamed protein product [Rotaria sp. Silwood2]